MKYALIINGIVDTIALTQPGSWGMVGTKKTFVPDKRFVPAGDDVFAGDVVSKDGAISRPPAAAPTSSDVNAERNRRIASGFTFEGVPYDYDSNSKANITGAAQLAFMAISAGAAVGNTRWQGPGITFAWISADNRMIEMDAQTVVRFGTAAAMHEQALIYAARAIKDQAEMPRDFFSDKYWP